MIRQKFPKMTMGTLLTAVFLALASVAIAQESSQQGVLPLGQMSVEQLTKSIADARVEINNAIQQAEVYPAHRNECLDNRDAWRVELMSLQDALIRRLQSDLGVVTSERDGLRTELASVTGERDRLQASITAATAAQSGSPRPDSSVRVEVQQTTTASVDSSTPPPPPPVGQPKTETTSTASQPTEIPYGPIGGGVLVLLLLLLALNYKYEWVAGDKIREHKAKRAAAKAERELVSIKGKLKELVQSVSGTGSSIEKEMGQLEDEVETLKKQVPVDQDRVDAAVAKKTRLGRPATNVADKVDDVKRLCDDLDSLTDLDAAKKLLEEVNKAMGEVQKALTAYGEAKKPPAPKK